MSELALQLQQGLRCLGLDLSVEQQDRLLAYQCLIQKWNKTYNLTAVRNPQEMLTHHLLDSLSIIPSMRRHMASCALTRQGQVLDVGSGAGLPGVVLAICLPEIGVTCVDAVGKKSAFVQQAANELGLANLKSIHSRVEGLVNQNTFDVIVSRAFATLFDFTGLTQPLLREGGVWAAMKANIKEQETNALPKTVEMFHVERLDVPGLNELRCLVWLKGRA